MTFSRASRLVIILTLFSSATFASKQEMDAAALIERAKQLSDIRAEGAPPFRLKIDFKIINDDASVVDGSYTETWVSKAQWRRETDLGDFRRVQIVAGKKLWVVDSMTVFLREMADIPGITDINKLRPDQWKSGKDHDINGIRVHCLENSLSAKWEACFETASGTLYAELSPSYPPTEGDKRVCLHSDYQKFGEYTVARSYECQDGRHRKLQARVVDLATYTTQDPTLFVPPEGAKESTNCLGASKPPAVIHRVDPSTPRAFSGTNVVTINVVVGIDGNPHNLQVISAPNRDYDEAALEAVRQWRFNPATCDGEPMEVLIQVETEFHRF